MSQRSLLVPAVRQPPGPRVALLAKGFRPFFWLAALHAVLAMPAWLFALSGKAAVGAYFGANFWHAHEMVFGFTVAVIAGFLLTAVGNWTERETAVGAPLALLALLWVAGRIGILASALLPRGLPAVLDVAFLPALALACAIPIARTKNARNYQFVLMLSVLTVANLGMHLGALGIAPAWLRRGAWLGVWAVVAMMLVMTARVVPMFTRNATRADGIVSSPRLNRAALAATLVTAAADLLEIDPRAVAALSALAGALVLARAARWGAAHTLGTPLLWVLHLGHAFIGIGLLGKALGAVWPALGPTVALHALTAGGIGLLTIGMMARVSLGHTGRMLVARPVMGVAFALVAVAAVVRVGAPMISVAAYLPAMLGSGVLFALAFAIYLVVYTPILRAPRVDGKPG